MIVRYASLLALLALSCNIVAQDAPTKADDEPNANASVAAAATSDGDANTSDDDAKPVPSEPANNSQTTATEPIVEAQGNTPGSEAVPEATSEDSQARAARLKDLLSLVRDNTKTIHKRENPAYFLLVKEVLERTTEELQKEVTTNPRFHDLYSKPGDYRGELVHVRLNARRVLPIDVNIRNAAGVSRLYEIWGWTEEAKAWMYCCVVPELPAGFPEEGDIIESIELTGYFFKMQGYQPGNAAPNARDLVAPLIIGRVVKAPLIEARAGNSMGNWPFILIIGFGCIVMFRILLHVRGMGRTPPVRRNYRRRSLEPIDADSLTDALQGPERGIRIRNANEV